MSMLRDRADRPARWIRSHPLITFLLVATFAMTVLAADSCSGSTQPSANQQDQNYTANQMQQYEKVEPPPFFTFSEPRDVMIQIYEAEMQAHNTWSVWVDRAGIAHGCASIGYPIMGGTQLTNPSSLSTDGYHYGVTLPQAEPNGLYPPATGAGTWVLCQHNGQAAPVYVEPEVMTYPWPVVVQDGKIVDLGGASTVNVTVRASTQATPAPSATPAP